MAHLFTEEFLRKLERLTLLSRQAMTGQYQGERRSIKRGQSIEFADFRPYVSGDDFRRIDWNAYARMEKFFIKLFVEEEDLTVHLLIDASQSMDWGSPNKLKYAFHLAGAIGYIALVGLDRIALTIFDGKQNPFRLPPIRGKHSALNLFDFLDYHLHAISKRETNAANKTDDNQRNKSVSLQAGAYAANTHPGPLILISDLLEDGWRQAISTSASRGFDISIAHILSPDEIDPGLDGDFKLVDSESQSFIELTADFESLTTYRQILRDWQDEWQRFCSARQAQFLPINTAISLDDILFGHLRVKGILK